MKNNNKKTEKETVTSTIANLPQELRDRIVIVGAGDASIGKGLSGTVNACTALSSNGTNGITAKASEPKTEKTEKEDIEISINYGTSGGSIKSQLKAQGFKFDKDFIKGCESVRLDLLALLDIDILTIKQGQKAFSRLNIMVSENVIEATFGDVKSKLKKTLINNKEVK